MSKFEVELGFYFGMVLKHFRTDFLFSHVWGLWFRALAVQDRFRWKKWRFPRAFTFLLSKKVDAWQLKLSQSADMKNWLRFVKQILYVLKYMSFCTRVSFMKTSTFESGKSWLRIPVSVTRLDWAREFYVEVAMRLITSRWRDNFRITLVYNWIKIRYLTSASMKTGQNGPFSPFDICIFVFVQLCFNLGGKSLLLTVPRYPVVSHTCLF